MLLSLDTMNRPQWDKRAPNPQEASYFNPPRFQGLLGTTSERSQAREGGASGQQPVLAELGHTPLGAKLPGLQGQCLPSAVL